MQYNPNNFELRQKLEEWSKDPQKYQTEGISYLKEKGKDSFEYLEALFNNYFLSLQIFDADNVIIDMIKNDEVFKKILEYYFALYDQCSDTPDEALWVVTILNKVEPDINKHRKLVFLLKEAGKNLLSMQEFENMVELYPDQVTDLEKASTYLFSELPEYEDKAKEIVKGLDTEKFYPSLDTINIGSLKFYCGENYDGLIYHFGGEDFRPQNFVSKKMIPNSKTFDFNGKSVVITPYRGMGDSMILSRFIPKFLEKWPKVKLTIATEKSMIPLYKNIPGIHYVGDMNACAGRMFDVCLGVNMLARYLREQLVDENGCIPYHEWVAYSSEYDDKWKEILPKDKPLIGINWKGSQRLGGSPANDENDGRNTSRDVEFDDFKYIIEMHEDKNFLCLNPDIWPEEREWLEKQPNVIIPTKIKDFGDTAAMINLCDVVASVDTSITTLSASLSKDTIVLAKYWPDYRWLYYEKWWDTSKFNVKVFRKRNYKEDWHHVVCQTMVELKKYSKNVH